ncbi:MAG: hypothetical protein L6R48_08140 [Planctomycetes bacterium]|nr:hypothetical protein [Planctomycetota bacterium]
MRRRLQVATTLLLAVAGFAAWSACSLYPTHRMEERQGLGQPSATGAATQQPMGAWAPQFVAPLPAATRADTRP